MFRSYILVAIRNLLKQRLYAVINVAGLGIGVGCVILISLFVKHELDYDRHFPNGDRLYRVIRELRTDDGGKTYDWRLSGAVGPALTETFPEVEATVRTMPRTVWIQHEDKVLRRDFVLADANVFEVFQFPMVTGEWSSARQPSSVILTESTARDYFGEESPIGKLLTVEGSYIAGEYVVAGVMADPPPQSSIQFDMISTSVPTRFQRFWDMWNPAHVARVITIYAMTRENASPDAVEAKMPQMLERNYFPDFAEKNTYHLQPVPDVYLKSRRDFGLQEVLSIEGSVRYGEIGHVHAASATAVFILLIACVNFTNLTTARSAGRAREVGLRKVVGARRLQLAVQFLGESWILAAIGMVVGVAAVQLSLSPLNAYTGKNLALDIDATMVISLIGLTFLVGFVAGGYPALFLSRFRPVEVLKGSLAKGAKGGGLRKILVVFQFSTSVALIVVTLIIQDQMAYVQNKDLGFETEQVIETRLLWEYRNSSLSDTDQLWTRFETVKAAFLDHPNISAATVTRFPHGRGALQGLFVAHDQGTEAHRMRKNEVDSDFIPFFGIKVIAGRNFSEGAASRYREQAYVRRETAHLQNVPGGAEYVLNEAAVKSLGWTPEEAIGKLFGPQFHRPGVVTGVVKDYHTRTLHQSMEPAVIYCNDWVPKTTYLKVSPHNFDDTVAHMQGVWNRFLPIRPFEFSFMDDNLNRRYLQEQQLQRSMQVFAALAIFVACLGLLGLVSYLAEQRTQEVGIRKVVGASVGEVVRLFMQEFVVLAGVSCLVAWPVAYWALSEWLQGFAYRISMPVLPFVAGGVAMTAMTVLTIGYQVVRAARTDPVVALRQE
jgi:putative ABC transport system permease protein